MVGSIFKDERPKLGAVRDTSSMNWGEGIGTLCKALLGHLVQTLCCEHPQGTIEFQN